MTCVSLPEYAITATCAAWAGLVQPCTGCACNMTNQSYNHRFTVGGPKPERHLYYVQLVISLDDEAGPPYLTVQVLA